MIAKNIRWHLRRFKCFPAPAKFILLAVTWPKSLMLAVMQV